MVTVIDNTADLSAARAKEVLPVGFVPTMGNLHAGHVSLLEEALEEFKVVYFSIFVNPKQFGPNEDFNRYPRTLADDVALIAASAVKFPEAKIVIYAPKDPKEVFPEGEGHTVSVEHLSKILEGELRPGHFDGVTTVVHRLFELTRPAKAYFGLKDYQQYLVIRRMVKDLALPIVIQGMPIVREPEGLALSSRNQYLTPDQRREALLISRTLREVVTLIDGKRANLPRAKERIREALADKKWNYLLLRDAETLSEDLSGSARVTLLAVYQLGTTRLLDNMQTELR
jgi:pantoate--beta-alanine ligase